MNTETQTAPRWTHRGIEITFNLKHASFHAVIGGKRQTAPSLDAMKKRIDDTAEMNFEPFDAYIELAGYSARDLTPDQIVMEIVEQKKSTSFSNEIRHCLVRSRIIGIDRKEKQFVDSDGRTHWSVIEATPEAAQRWRELFEARNRKDARMAQLDAEISDAHKLVPFRSAGEELKKDAAS